MDRLRTSEHGGPAVILLLVAVARRVLDGRAGGGVGSGADFAGGVAGGVADGGDGAAGGGAGLDAAGGAGWWGRGLDANGRLRTRVEGRRRRACCQPDRGSMTRGVGRGDAGCAEFSAAGSGDGELSRWWSLTSRRGTRRRRRRGARSCSGGRRRAWPGLLILGVGTAGDSVRGCRGRLDG